MLLSRNGRSSGNFQDKVRILAGNTENEIHNQCRIVRKRLTPKIKMVQADEKVSVCCVDILRW